MPVSTGIKDVSYVETGSAFTERFATGGRPTLTPVARISLAAAGPPGTRTTHSIKIRGRVQSGTGTFRAALYEGATNRSGDLESAALSTSLADYQLPISNASAAAITSYADLEIRVWGYNNAGAANTFEIAELSLIAPTAVYVKASSSVKDDVATGVSAKVAGQTTYQKNGVSVSGRFVVGPDAASFTETGATESHRVTVGQDVGSFVETGASVTRRYAAGTETKAATPTKTGVSVTGHHTTGPDAASFTEKGASVKDDDATGASSKTTGGTLYQKSGVSVRRLYATGPKLRTSEKTGAAYRTTDARGLDFYTAAKVGVAQMGRVLRGDRALARNETGASQLTHFSTGFKTRFDIGPAGTILLDHAGRIEQDDTGGIEPTLTGAFT